jgi:4-amino-4-deoxy-L-arabinose transferase-like glycosyltransferase
LAGRFKVNEKKVASLFLLSILCLGAFLRLYNLGPPSLETDEISSVSISKSSVAEIIDHNIHPYKYDVVLEGSFLPYLLIHAMLKIRDSDFMTRIPFALLGIISILVIYLLSKEWFGRICALWSSFLLSISIYHISYSQLARGYGGLILFTILAVYFLWRYMHSYNPKDLLGLVISNALGIYFHYVMLQVIIIELLVVLFLKISDKPQRNILKFLIKISGIILFSLILLTMPILRNIIATAKGRLSGQAIPFEFNPLYFKNLLCRYGAGNGATFFIYNFFFLYGLIKAFKYKRKIFVVLLIWLTFPFLLLSRGYQYFFHIRYIIYTFPVYILLTGYGITCFAEDLLSKKRKILFLRPAIHFLIFIVFLSLNIIPLKLYYQMPARMTDFKTIAIYIAENYRPENKIYIESSFCVRELGFYLNKLRSGIKINTFNGNIEEFQAECKANGNVIWYVDNNPVFDSLVMKYFHKRMVFGSEVFYELGRRELIDWDKSWFGADNIRRYFPVIYFN